MLSQNSPADAPEHWSLAQSASPRQVSVSAQRSHLAPPQSTSLSSPFFAPSEQLTQSALPPAAAVA